MFFFLPSIPKYYHGLPKKNGDPIARRIAKDRENRRKFHPEKNGDHFFSKITTDRIAEGIPDNNGDHFGGEI